MRPAVAAGVALLLALPAGCGSGPDPEEAADEAAASRKEVVSALQQAASVAGSAGSVGQATGSYAVCGSAPTEGVEYRASVPVRADGGPASGVPAITGQLADDGWTVVDEGTDPAPWSNLERDGLAGSVRVDPRKDSRALLVAVAGPCVRLAEGQTGDFELSKERLDLS